MRFAERERTTRLADAVLKHLGLGPDQLDALQALPLARLQEAVAPAQATLPRPRYPLLDRYNFGPVIDGRVLPGQPFDPAAPAVSDDVPILIGGTKDEIVDLPRARRRGVEPHRHRGRSAQAHRGCRRRRGRQSAGLLQAARSGGQSVRPADHGAHRVELRRALGASGGAQGRARARAPVWMYSFDWETPAFGGRLKSPHSVDVPFVFDTLRVIGEAHRKPGAQALADRVSKTWATFARTGDPGNEAIPAWPAYTAERRATMLLDEACKVVDDPDGEVRPLWNKVATA